MAPASLDNCHSNEELLFFAVCSRMAAISLVVADAPRREASQGASATEWRLWHEVTRTGLQWAIRG